MSSLAGDGPRFAAALEAHARSYDTDIIAGQRMRAVEPAPRADGLIALVLDNGAVLRGRSVVLAPGARWSTLRIPYRNRGVADCPHCDGPLLKGRALAVVGGGNSGVEAAIDLAGLASQVTLLELGEQLRADAVLVARLRSLPNVNVVTGAQTTEITGDGRQVDGLRCNARAAGEAAKAALGAFDHLMRTPVPAAHAPHAGRGGPSAPASQPKRGAVDQVVLAPAAGDLQRAEAVA